MVESEDMASSKATTVRGNDMQRSTGIGRPMQQYKSSAWGNFATNFTGQAPQHLPMHFKDSDMIPVPVPIESNQEHKGRKSWIGKMKDKVTGKDDKQFKIVHMTRGEYLEKYGRDEKGEYVGTEPEPGNKD